MDLTTRWLGFDLAHPIVPGAGPLCDDLDGIRRLEDAGAPMLTLRSLFEEQIVGEQLALVHAIDSASDAFAEAGSFLPGARDFVLGPDEYLEQLRRAKAATRLPIVASLNGTTLGGWLDYAELLEQAGADALELNLYDLATDPERTSAQVEAALCDVVHAVRKRIRLPIAVKLSPFFSSLPHVANRLVKAGADGLVLFNRFYQPDVDPVAQEYRPTLRLSTPGELNLRLRWVAILHGRVGAPLALTGGVHHGSDVVKALQCGASTVQVVSALLAHGVDKLRHLVSELETWMEEHDWQSARSLVGCMSHQHCPDPKQLERANYARLLQSWTRD